MAYITIYTTLPDEKSVKELLKKLLEERLVACGNFFKINSLYWWQSKIEEQNEYGVILKTKEKLYPLVEKKIKELHPYEVPAIISHRIEMGLKEYLDWIGKETKE